MLAYEVVGSGEPLLLIHGISHRRQAWQPVVDRLAQHHEVILVDLPGHGESPALDLDGRSVRTALTEQLHELREHLGHETWHVVGNSLGGLIALEMGELGAARTITVLSPAGFWLGRLDFLYIHSLFTGVQAAARLMRPFAPRVMGSRLGRTLALGWSAAHPSRISAEAALGDLDNMIASRDAIRTMFTGVYEFEGDGETPTTVAWGTRDLTLLPYQALVARRRLPRAQHVWLHGCGHVPMTDDPDLVADTILARTGAAARQRTVV